MIMYALCNKTDVTYYGKVINLLFISFAETPI